MGQLHDLWQLRSQGNLGRNEFRLYASEVISVVNDLPDFISRSGIREVRISRNGLLLEFEDGSIFSWDPQQIGSAGNLHLLEGSYESMETSVLLHIAATADSFVDIGANVGFFTIRLSNSHRRLRTTAIEATPSTAAILAKNVELNALNDRVDIFNCAVGSREGRCHVFIPKISGHSAASTANLHPEEETQVLEVEMKRLDTLLPCNLMKHDLVKIDVEGAEYDVLLGSTRILKEGRPTVFAELLRKWMKPFGRHPNDVISMMSTYGYRTLQFAKFGLQEISFVDENTIPTNFLFVQGDQFDNLRTNGFVLV